MNNEAYVKFSRRRAKMLTVVATWHACEMRLNQLV